jgi:hypothetical protein
MAPFTPELDARYLAASVDLISEADVGAGGASRRDDVVEDVPCPPPPPCLAFSAVSRLQANAPALTHSQRSALVPSSVAVVDQPAAGRSLAPRRPPPPPPRAADQSEHLLLSEAAVSALIDMCVPVSFKGADRGADSGASVGVGAGAGVGLGWPAEVGSGGESDENDEEEEEAAWLRAQRAQRAQRGAARLQNGLSQPPHAHPAAVGAGQPARSCLGGVAAAVGGRHSLVDRPPPPTLARYAAAGARVEAAQRARSVAAGASAASLLVDAVCEAVVAATASAREVGVSRCVSDGCGSDSACLPACLLARPLSCLLSFLFPSVGLTG